MLNVPDEVLFSEDCSAIDVRSVDLVLLVWSPIKELEGSSDGLEWALQHTLSIVRDVFIVCVRWNLHRHCLKLIFLTNVLFG